MMRLAAAPSREALDHGHAAGDGCFIFERDAAALGFMGEIEAMIGDHRLFGGDEGLAGL